MGGVGSGAKARIYTPEETQQGLWLLALHGGNCNSASRALAGAGFTISRWTLTRWKNETHADRYHEICEKAQVEITGRIAIQAEAIMLQAGALEEQLIEEIRKAIEDGTMPAKDLAATLRNLSTTKALNNDKIAAPIRGRPSQITEHRSADQILAKLAALGVIDTTAEDIPAELPA